MIYEVVVTRAAKANLRSAYLWTAEHAPETAARWLNRFEAALQTLDRFPERCPEAQESKLLVPQIRQLVFGKRSGAYRALFTIIGNQVRVLHVRRGSRDWATAEELKDDGS